MTIWTGIALPSLLFVGGVSVLVFSVERLVESLTRAGVATGVSPFFLSVGFAGLDFESWAFGIAAGSTVFTESPSAPPSDRPSSFAARPSRWPDSRLLSARRCRGSIWP